MIKGARVTLRALEPGDLDLLYEWENDTSVWLVSGTVAPFSHFVLEQYLATAHQDIYVNKELRLMIDLNEDDENFPDVISLGCIDLFDFDPKNLRAGVGVLIGNKDLRNKGYGTEALRLLMDYAFDTLDLHQLYCNITVNNEISLHVFKKLGFEITGLKQDWVFHEGKWFDEYLLQNIQKSTSSARRK